MLKVGHHKGNDKDDEADPPVIVYQQHGGQEQNDLRGGLRREQRVGSDGETHVSMEHAVVVGAV